MTISAGVASLSDRFQDMDTVMACQETPGTNDATSTKRAAGPDRPEHPKALLFPRSSRQLSRSGALTRCILAPAIHSALEGLVDECLAAEGNAMISMPFRAALPSMDGARLEDHKLYGKASVRDSSWHM